ncbi:EVE domain-containing protein [Candidatus Parcubacteria bacterium]|nr:EVE domain-containing protein [Candidatus Parcubacteria bacterium]
MNYWLLKIEAACFSIDDMKREKKVPWTGIRNYQARNFMRDKMKVGDLALFYHSSADPTAAVGVVKVVSEAYPDPTQFDKKDDHFDPKATKEKPMWSVVDVQFVRKFKQPISLHQMKIRPDLVGMSVTQKGSRLSVLPVSEKHFKIIEELGNKISSFAA